MRMKSELLTDRLAIRGRERNEENGVRFADIVRDYFNVGGHIRCKRLFSKSIDASSIQAEKVAKNPV